MLVIGHRGASATHRENTVEAFRAARDQGADGVELDVRRTADGALAIHHDAALDDGRFIVDLRFADLPPHVADLAGALDACAGLDLVNIELKNWPDDPDFDERMALADQVVELVRARGERERALVSCFHLPTVDRVRALDPGLATAWLVLDPGDDASAVDRVVERGHVALHPHHVFVTEHLVTTAHDAGIAVNTWTCDDPDRLRWLASIGVDAVVVNDVAAAVAVLAGDAR